jgi:agmatine deiminase
VTASPRTPAAEGYRFPAEWEPHEATWIGWPHNPADWPGKFPPIPWVFAEIVRMLSPGEVVRILVQDAAHEAKARRVLGRAGVEEGRVEFFRFPTDRGWTRDMGPIFLSRKGKSPGVAVAEFGFDAWSKYDNFSLDAKTHARAAKALGLPLLKPRRPDNGRRLVLEGGAIDVNGRGTVITTEECLLDPVTQVRNPGLSREGVERALEETLGVTNVVWLGKGIAGDDTHGHVDDLCRFVNPTTVVLCEEKDRSDANHAALAENRERLAGARLEDGSPIRVVPLPMPSPLFFEGVRLPASYANFYIGNAVVIVPTFNDPNDRVALGILAGLFPGRRVVGIHAVDLVWGFGTLHCLTQQQPAR